jgi:RimJ/RimL family protein N-acetyltransferase
MPRPALPCLYPDAALLAGGLVDLERVDPARHTDDLWSSIGRDAALWSLIPPGPFADAEAFAAWLTDRANRPSAALYAIVDKTTGHAVGLFFLLNINPAMGVAEMGLVYGPALARRTAGTEAFFLLAGYILDTLGYRRLEWRCSPEHTASRRAAIRFGFTEEGLLRQTMWVKDRNWDTQLYAMLDREWPAVASGLTAWLSPENFRADGRQITPLISPNRPSDL